MCWNAEVSLNTFAFSSFVLALIIYNNQFTKYKIQELNDKWVYLFFASFILMQLIEFFIWKNINNPFYNKILSICATLLLCMQPAISIMILKNIQLRNILLLSYLLIIIPYSMYNFMHKRIHTTVSSNGHLIWNFFYTNAFVWITWLFFLLFSHVYEKNWFGVIFGLITLFISFIHYKNENAMGSMWCWSINFGMVYYAIYLLMYLPYLERGCVC